MQQQNNMQLSSTQNTSMETVGRPPWQHAHHETNQCSVVRLSTDTCDTKHLQQSKSCEPPNDPALALLLTLEKLGCYAVTWP